MPKVPKPKPITPEQAKRREFIAERNRRIMERGVPAPASGIFGGKLKEPKK